MYFTSRQSLSKDHPPENVADEVERSDILTAVHLLTDLEAGCVEMRVIDHDGNITRGFYDDLNQLADDAALIDAGKVAKGIYITANPVKREMLLRSRNQVSTGEATKDLDIVARRWLLFDIDAVRPKDTSATDEQHDQALNRMAEVRAFICELGWGDPVSGDSGNGGHLLYRVNLPNDAASLALIKSVLGVIASHFSDKHVKVDLTVCNAGRIWKLYGTTARKGEATDERPHRQARLLTVPDELRVTTEEQLRALLPPEPEPVKHQHDPASAGAWDELKAQLRGVLSGYKKKEARGYFYAPGRCHGSTDGQSIWMRLDNNAVGCFKGCSIGNILTAHGLPAFPVSAKVYFGRNQTSEGESKPADAGDDRADKDDDEEFYLTDVGNAKRLVKQHGAALRYCYPFSNWLSWDGKRWQLDVTGEAERRAKDTIARVRIEAALLEDKANRTALWNHARNSESDSRLRAMLSQARSEVGIAIKPDDLDSNPLLLNVNNGTLNLQNGELRPHRQADLITKLAPVDYDPHADCPMWESFLATIMGSKPGLTNFLRRAIGYSLTGDTSERAMFILYGSGANGKSTALETIRAVVGDYAARTPAETLLARRDNAIPNDVAKLKGARFVSASETDEGRRLAEAQIKDLTGGDTISARFMRAEWFDFKPECKLWLSTNHRPVVRGTDKAIWDRLKLIPFNVRIPEEQQDRKLLSKLKTELPGILAWAVRGCLEWQAEGLGVPEEVRNATGNYQSEMDVLANFIADACMLTSDARAGATSLFQAYKRWCDDNGERCGSQRGFSASLTERGFFKRRSGKTGTEEWQGIGRAEGTNY